jgi:hypothetical protein
MVEDEPCRGCSMSHSQYPGLCGEFPRLSNVGLDSASISGPWDPDHDAEPVLDTGGKQNVA